jgi:two-component system response regulator ResD
MPPEKILIIEDESKISDVVKSYLEKDGYFVAVADSGEKALHQIKKSFDLIILDLMLPDIDGESLCGAIRESSNVPVIMLTAKSSEEDRVKGLGLGADDYVVKPFSARELVARVKAILRRTKEKEKKQLSFNKKALLIDPLSMEVRKDGNQIPLTITEFRILLCLAENPQIVFSRAQLVQQIQGYDFEGYERVIDTHIKNIRLKIESDPHQPVFIKTMYGAGYKFTGIPD